jgi:hypothetical protein
VRSRAAARPRAVRHRSRRHTRPVGRRRAMQESRPRLADITGQHRIKGDRDGGRCIDCGVLVWRRLDTRGRGEANVRGWLEWLAPDGRDWSSFPEGDGWVTYPDSAPTCPPQAVEARCPWEPDARRYGRAWGDVQLEAAMQTWCERHQVAVAECPNPGPPCRGADGNCAWGEGRCTGDGDTCRCMCPVCVGDTPDVWGYDGDY